MNNNRFTIPAKERMAYFENHWLEKVKENHIVKKENAQNYVIYSSRYGVIDFFPAKDRCFLRKKQRWIKPGLEWILKTFCNNG